MNQLRLIAAANLRGLAFQWYPSQTFALGLTVNLTFDLVVSF